MEITEIEEELFFQLRYASEHNKPAIIERIFKLWLLQNGFSIKSVSDDKKIVIIGEGVK